MVITPDLSRTISSMPWSMRLLAPDGVPGGTRPARPIIKSGSIQMEAARLNTLTGLDQTDERLNLVNWLRKHDRPDTASPVAGRTDLHLHSNYSDGYDVPSMVVYRAWKSGLLAISLTDHDCVAGIDEALQAGSILGIRVVPGVEIGVEADPVEYGMNSAERTRADVLLYFPDLERFNRLRSTEVFCEFEALLNRAQSVWFDWVEKIRQRFNLLHLSEGLEISRESLEKSMRGTFVPTRTHIIQAGLSVLAEKTGIRDTKEFLNTYLFAPGNEEEAAKSAFVNKSETVFTPKLFAEMAVRTGAVSVIAHPCEYSDPLLQHLMDDLSSVTVNGRTYCAAQAIEVFAAKAKDEEVAKYEAFRRTLNNSHPVFMSHPLFFTAGSDSHGPDYTPKLRMGLDGRIYPSEDRILQNLLETHEKTPVTI